MAEWAAVRYSSDHIFDYIRLTPDHAIYEIAVPESWIGKTIVELGVRQRYHINILAVNHGGELEPLPGPDHCFQNQETVFILGGNKDVQKFLRI